MLGLSSGCLKRCAAGLLPNSSQLTLGSQFAAEFNNIAAVSWPATPNANAAWLEQAKVAAILPMYTVFSAGALKPKQVLSFYQVEATTFNSEIELTVQNNIVASSAVIPSSAVPVNTGTFSCKMENNNMHNLSSQPSTPQQRSQQPNAAMASTQSSPASAMLVIDRQPGSIQSHCSTEMRPCSTSSMGPSSVPTHSSGIPHENGSDNNLEDLPWSSIDLADIDLFSGSSVAEKDVMHSVLDEMDPTVMHRLFLNEPSTASGPNKLPMNAAQLVTPKIREKIKLKREKELADADKELDRLLSLVAKKDAISTPVSKVPKPLQALDSVPLTKADTSDDHKISLSPVQFTPPDSPTPSTSGGISSALCNFFFPSSGTSISTAAFRSRSTRNEILSAKTRFLFMPPTEKKNKSNKVPVYKQKAKSFLQSMLKTDEHGNRFKHLAPDDAYSFKDDEEESKPLPSSATVSETQLREQRLEAEVAQRLARINSAHPELKTKIGNDEPQYQQDLWRHVVPKKRLSAASERPSVPSTPLLPPASVNEHRAESSSNQKVAEPQTIVDLLLRRKQHRSSFGFLKTKSLGDKETAKNEQQIGPSVITIRVEPKTNCSTGNGSVFFLSIYLMELVYRAQSEQPLPKLLIRLPRRSVDENTVEYEKSKKKKKKRKKRDSDHEWIGPDSRGKKKKKRKHRHHHKKKKRHASDCEEALTNKQDEQWNASENVSKETTVFSKKRRLIMHWNEREGNRVESEYYRDRNSSVSFENNGGHNKNPESSQHSILSKFHPVDGHLAKGTFVVCKADILKEDCPLWRVDNQNLLQKYPPFNLDGKIAYRNSSTYSGWCDQIADSYIVVRIRFIKHSRSESIVEPEMPLLDMFPAISVEYEERSSTNSGIAPEQKDLFADDPIRKQMAVYVKAMLNHALDMTFLQTVRQKSDWNYLCALNGINKLNQERKEKVQLRVKWIQRYLDLLHFYSSCVICDSEDSGLSCQACGISGVEKVVQLFCNEGYDYDTLEAEEVCYTGSGSPLHAVVKILLKLLSSSPRTQPVLKEYLVCSSCAKLSRIYHKLHHMRYILLKNCEDKLEKVSAGNVDISSEFVVETCMNDVIWLRSVVNEYADLWRRIDMNAC
ncbi:unnamed protein product [Onchocerca flexuosa]|uniref:DUF4211 domain-containing protein n=1 Tax=Onchocerca flexuosa TaxID=387005 RepID=A0A183HZ50_9BILA|nr:unnamed protein product [Onchocerca flexuosa]